MSLNFGIYWVSGTNEYSTLAIDSNDPDEPYESGYRNTYRPFPDEHPNDQEYKEIYKKMFSDGPKLKFIQSDTFTGSLYGYIFQMGKKGLGYYIDPLVMRHVYYS